MANDTDDTNAPPDGSGDSSGTDTRKALLLSGVVLGVPPLLAAVSAFWPGLIPVPFAAADDPASIQPIMLVVAALLAVFNAGFLYLIHQMLEN